MATQLSKKTDQELADLIRQNSQLPNGDGFFGKLKEKAKLSFRYKRECKKRGTDILTLLKNNPHS
jgi:hypothetical protein